MYTFQPASWDPANPNAAWAFEGQLRNKRYYPTVALGHERWVYIARGHTDDADPYDVYVEDDFEVWNRALNNNKGALDPNVPTQDGPNPHNEFGLAVALTYPRLHLLSNGHLFHAGMDSESASNLPPPDPVNNPWTWTGKGTSDHTYRFYGTSVRFPNIDAKHTDAILILGGQAGNGTVLDTVQICKGTALNPGSFHASVQGYDWTPIYPGPLGNPFPPMLHQRYALNAVLLPDASILVLGGTSTGEGIDPPSYPLQAERFRNGQWEPLAYMNTNRRYHATTLLLPSGQVLIAGGEGRNLDYELYNPPYMYLPRPWWDPDPNKAPQENVSYGGIYPVHFGLPDGSALGKVVLMRPGCNTHHFDADQRYHQLTLLPALDEGPPSPRYYQLPTNPDALPPGYYMIWLVTAGGVPSDARWIKVQ